MRKEMVTEHPFADRAHPQMQTLWNPAHKIALEREFWVQVMRVQSEFIPEQISQVDIGAYAKQVWQTPDFASIAQRERVLRHDVKARLEEFNACAGGLEKAHLGMTGRDLDDNVELIQAVDALGILIGQLEMFQNGPLIEPLHNLQGRMRLRGIVGPVGTGADQIDLIGEVGLEELNRRIPRYYGFPRGVMDSVGQVYPRSVDYQTASVIQCAVAQTPVNPVWNVLIRGYAGMLAELAGGQWNEGDVSCSVVRRVAIANLFLAASAAIRESLTQTLEKERIVMEPFVPQHYQALREAALECLDAAEQAAHRAKARSSILKRQVRIELAARARARRLPAPSETQVDLVTQTRAATDPQWKSLVAANRWNLDKSRTYAACAAMFNPAEREPGGKT